MSVFHNCTGLPRQLFSHLENQCFHDLWPHSSCWVSLLQVVPWMETKQIYNSKEARVNVFNKIMLLKGTVKQIISKFQLVLENLRDMMKPYVCSLPPPPPPSSWQAIGGPGGGLIWTYTYQADSYKETVQGHYSTQRVPFDASVRRTTCSKVCFQKQGFEI